ncbi:hypothetical protein J1614_007857 [Plenodomus biglobosus]|nr:hypothetical protein J1614_007857 [Plenodomus biglobosus]
MVHTGSIPLSLANGEQRSSTMDSRERQNASPDPRSRPPVGSAEAFVKPEWNVHHGDRHSGR